MSLRPEAFDVAEEVSLFVGELAIGVHHLKHGAPEAPDRRIIHLLNAGEIFLDHVWAGAQFLDHSGEVFEHGDGKRCRALPIFLHMYELALNIDLDHVQFVTMKMPVGSRCKCEQGNHRAQGAAHHRCMVERSCFGFTFEAREQQKINSDDITEESCWVEDLAVGRDDVGNPVDAECSGCIAFVAECLHHRTLFAGLYLKDRDCAHCGDARAITVFDGDVELVSFYRSGVVTADTSPLYCRGFRRKNILGCLGIIPLGQDFFLITEVSRRNSLTVSLGAVGQKIFWVHELASDAGVVPLRNHTAIFAAVKTLTPNAPPEKDVA